MPASPVSESAELTALRHRHLLGLATYGADELRLVVRTAREMRAVLDRQIKRVPSLRGVTVVNLFFESSTRTRISFELAEKRLSADVVNFSASGSSVAKGETLRDTARNIEAMRTDMVVVRHASPGAAQMLTRWIDGVVINAGDGAHEHPTQALLDVLTISDLDVPRLRRPDGTSPLSSADFRGLRVSILGDVAHSRVARSNLYALRRLGADVTLCGPRTMLPPHPEAFADTPAGEAPMPGGFRVTDRLDDALDGCDVAMALRIQLERQGAGPNGLLPSVREYHERFGLRMEHLDRHPDLFVMHPGPINRGVELAHEVADHERSVILRQVTNGVAVRMAVLFLLAPAGGA